MKQIDCVCVFMVYVGVIWKKFHKYRNFLEGHYVFI